MKKINLLFAVTFLVAPLAWSQTSAVADSTKRSSTGPVSCSAAAQEKKLAGAAKSSFFKKCEREATDRCEAAAAERKLAGAAKQSNVKKCIKDAVGQ
jgi:hypothetical protein